MLKQLRGGGWASQAALAGLPHALPHTTVEPHHPLRLPGLQTFWAWWASSLSVWRQSCSWACWRTVREQDRGLGKGSRVVKRAWFWYLPAHGHASVR